MEQPSSSTKAILAEFDDRVGLYEDFRGTCEELLSRLLHVEGLRVHSVSSRVKDRRHLEEKIGKQQKGYQSASDVTDIVGLRVITHFEDDVDRIAAVVEREFGIDSARSIDKRKVLDPDRFGYLSLHYICSITAERAKLAEYRRYQGLVCEIQIRSILQHAWAEIEHDLGYKAGTPIPAPIRRRFSRLAGLLEIADYEFSVIRNDLANYKGRVTEEIRQDPSSVGVDDVSLKAFIESDAISLDIDQQMATHAGARLDEPSLQLLAEMLQYAGIRTIEELRNALLARKELLLRQFKSRMGQSESLASGIGIFHLFQVIIADKDDPNEMEKAFEKFRIADPGESYAAAGLEVLAAIQASR